MNNIRSGFMLLEAILTVLVASICLTFIMQSLWTNFRIGLRFQEMTRSVLVMENRLGALWATKASGHQLNASPMPLETTYQNFTASAEAQTLDSHLEKVELQVNSPLGKIQGPLNVTTIIYNPNGTYAVNRSS